MLDTGPTRVPILAHGCFKNFVDGAVSTQSEVGVPGFAELRTDTSPLPLTLIRLGLDVQTLHDILMDSVCQGEGKLHQGFGFFVPNVEDLLRKIGPELGCERFVVNTRTEETPRGTTSTDIKHGTTLPKFALIRVLERIVVPEKSEECIVLLTTILAIARGASSVQAVRMERQATFLDDQDTLRIHTESGIGIEEIACDDACAHASADDNDVVFLGGCLLRSELEPLRLKCLMSLNLLAHWQEFEDPLLGIDLDNKYKVLGLPSLISRRTYVLILVEMDALIWVEVRWTYFESHKISLTFSEL